MTNPLVGIPPFYLPFLQLQEIVQSMNCLHCDNKACKTDGKDCNVNRDAALSLYHLRETEDTYRHADSLISGGRAGTLSRLEEIIEFCRVEKYKTVGIAYCFGIETLADELRLHLQKGGLNVRSYRCTINGIRENEVHESLGTAIGCNPVGQALAINNEKIDFVVEMGLCLGHDVLFHSTLKVPHTVFMVKDRVFNHNPALAFENYSDKNSSFLEHMDSSFRMKSPDWLQERIGQSDVGSSLVIVDVRNEAAFQKGHIPGSLNLPLKEMPVHYKKALGPPGEKEIVCVCSGSVQSAYAIMFLFSRGYSRVYNLSGGYSRWSRENSG